MALSLNLTLVIQAFNFMISYWFISRFFLKPAYGVLKAEESKLAHVHSQVAHEQEELAHLQERKREDWQSCQNYFYTYRPQLEHTVEKAVPVAPSITPAPELTEAQMDTMSLEIARALKPRVLYD